MHIRFLLSLTILMAGCMIEEVTADTNVAQKASDTMKTLWSAKAADSLPPWLVVNDGVMGGLSDSRMAIDQDTVGVFAGDVSLENNGGFASVRTVLESIDLTGYAGIRIRVMGDGKRYSFRIRTDDNFDGVAHRFHFETTADQWEEIDLPFAKFEATYRGRILTDAEHLDPKRIRQIGFLIADKQQGAFKLRIDWIAAYR